MKRGLRVIGLGLALVIAGAVIAAPKLSAQESSTEVNKRKVRTRVVPDYPPLAKQMNATGKVKIEATISADGRVTATKPVGGSPILIAAAEEALKKWRFEPGPKETVEVIEFDFSPQSE
ncbi:MAG: energy transducer TonB [Candidatus Acidiferrales bacterium]